MIMHVPPIHYLVFTTPYFKKNDLLHKDSRMAVFFLFQKEKKKKFTRK